MANNPFGGGKLPGNLGDIMKQAQQALAKTQEVETQLAAARVEGQSGGGAVKVSATGKGDVLEIKISKEAVDPNDIETLEDLVTIAVRDALDKANALKEEAFRGVMPAGLEFRLPGGLF